MSIPPVVHAMPPRLRAQVASIVDRLAPALLGTSIDAVLPEVLALLDAEEALLVALDSRPEGLRCLAAAGSRSAADALEPAVREIVRLTARHRRTFNVRDAADAGQLRLLGLEPALLLTGGGRGARELLATPMTVESYVLGVLVVVNRRSGRQPFSPAEAAAAETIGRALGAAALNLPDAPAQGARTPYGHLVARGLISAPELAQALAEAQASATPPESVLKARHGIAKLDVLESLSEFHGVPHYSYSGQRPMTGGLESKLNMSFLLKHGCVPVEHDSRTLVVACANPADLRGVDALRAMKLAPKVEIVVALRDDVERVIVDWYGERPPEEASAAVEELESLEQPDEDDVEIDAESEEDSEVVRLANQIILDAFHQGASDIHVEPQNARTGVRVRFRKDGECFVHKDVPWHYCRALISRLKIMARLDIAEKRRPQDGKIRLKSKSGTIELRVATLPTAGNNEDVVLRILAASEPIPLDELRFSERNLREWKTLIRRPYGICLVVGPTGSGKTTTLHSTLAFINSPSRKIWTAEDPIEITQPGLRQVQMHRKIGLTFATALRAFLRADPDVIMVGEMRDQETAQIGIESSLTGHLVFSTLHTNSAAETVTRLLDMGIDPFSFGDALLGVLAQRLMRTLCKACRKPYHPSEEEFLEIAGAFGGRLAQAVGASYTPDLKLFGPVGCTECMETGCRGRMGIHELLVSTGTIKEMIYTRAQVSRIHEESVKEGMETLMQDGLRKVLQGHATIQQVQSVCMR